MKCREFVSASRRVRAKLRLAILLPASLTVLAPAAHAQRADRAVYLDSASVVRWRDDRKEVTLFGANYVLPPPPPATARPVTSMPTASR